MGNYVLIKNVVFPENAIVETVTIIEGIRIMVESTEGGTASGGGRYAEGAEITLTATANSGYVLSHWTKNGSLFSYSSSLQIVVEEPAIYKAIFIETTNVFNQLTARRNYGYDSTGKIMASDGFIMSDFIDISNANKIVWSGFTPIDGVPIASILSNIAADSGGVRERNTQLGNSISGEFVLTDTIKQTYSYTSMCVFRTRTGTSEEQAAAANNADLSGVKIFII